MALFARQLTRWWLSAIQMKPHSFINEYDSGLDASIRSRSSNTERAKRILTPFDRQCLHKWTRTIEIVWRVKMKIIESQRKTERERKKRTKNWWSLSSKHDAVYTKDFTSGIVSAFFFSFSRFDSLVNTKSDENFQHVGSLPLFHFKASITTNSASRFFDFLLQ